MDGDDLKVTPDLAGLPPSFFIINTDGSMTPMVLVDDENWWGGKVLKVVSNGDDHPTV